MPFIVKICAQAKGNYESFLPKVRPGSAGICLFGGIEASQVWAPSFLARRSVSLPEKAMTQAYSTSQEEIDISGGCLAKAQGDTRELSSGQISRTKVLICFLTYSRVSPRIGAVGCRRLKRLTKPPLTEGEGRSAGFQPAGVGQPSVLLGTLNECQYQAQS